MGNNIDEIVSGDPDILDQVNTRFWTHLFGANSNWEPYMATVSSRALSNKPQPFQFQYPIVQSQILLVKKIFDYKIFSDKTTMPYNAYHLSKRLDRYTCSYCNRSFTSTVFKKSGEPIVRPTLDHWFPKWSHPLLAVSFYNLVPSCYPCNSSVKGTASLNLLNNIHPYKDVNQSLDFEFDYSYDAIDGFRIKLIDTPSGILDNSRAKNTMEDMFIHEVYNSNISELRDLISIKRNYSIKYIEKMQAQLQTRLSKTDVYRVLFGTTYEHESFHKRPLSKFKRDILKKLAMLDDM